MNNSRVKNVNIELLRCIACYFVIVIHTWGTFRLEGGTLHTEVFVAGVVARCAVPIFFMITGYVYSNKSSLRHKYRKFLLHILVPVLLMSFLSAMIIARGVHFFVDESQEYISFVEYLKIIFLTEGGRPRDLYLCGHFWYIEELIKFYLLLPILQFVLCDEKKANEIRRFYLILGFLIYFIIPILEKNAKIEMNNIYLPDGLMYIWYVVLGYELSQSKWKYAGKAGIACHWICVLIMSLLEYNLEYRVVGDIEHAYSSNASVFNLCSAVGIFLFVINLQIPQRFEHGLCCLGKETFGIYVVHVVVYNVLYHLNITVLLDYVPTVLFCFIYSTSVFLVSLMGIKILNMIMGTVQNKVQKHNHVQSNCGDV